MRLRTEERGATTVEYALIIALVVVLCLGAIQALQTKGTAKVDEGAAERGRPTEQLFLPSASGVIIGGGSGSTVGSGAATVEVFDIQGTSAEGQGSTWVATVTVKVKNVATPELWSGVTVTGTWFYLDSGTPKTASGTCPTDSTGLCTISLSGLKSNKTDSAEFRSITLTGSGITQQAPIPDPVSTSGPIAKPA
jgi:Flp pilus assembly pilin Flp